MTPGCFCVQFLGAGVISQRCHSFHVNVKNYHFHKKKTLPTSGLAWKLQRFQRSVVFLCKWCSFSKRLRHTAKERALLS